MDVEVYHNLKNVLNNEKITDLAHPRIKDYVKSEMSHMIEAAATCAPYSVAKRPQMGHVVRTFDGLAATLFQDKS